jgi:hypothetical protein
MIFSLLAGDNEPLLDMRCYAPKQAGRVVEPVGSGKSQEELSCIVQYHKNRISFSDFHIVSHAAQNQPIVIEPDARRYLMTKNMLQVFSQFENEGTAAPGGE